MKYPAVKIAEKLSLVLKDQEGMVRAFSADHGATINAL
jgi:hypothetical protein